MTFNQPSKRSNACIPCHQRKVRCDAAAVGTPCSRCVSKDRVRHCLIVPQRRRRSTKAAQGHENNQDYREQTSETTGEGDQNTPTIQPEDNGSLNVFHSGIDYRTGRPSNVPNIDVDSLELHQIMDKSDPGQPVPQIANSGPTMQNSDLIETARGHSPYAVSEEDAHVQALNRMADATPTHLSIPTGQSNSSYDHHVTEYFDRLNSISILSEVLGQRQRKRLIHVDLPGPESNSAKNRELAGLDPADVTYLNGKRVFDLPPREACSTLLRIYFEHIYPYAPILDRVKFCNEYLEGNCSHFLLYALFANVVPYASMDVLATAGYADRNVAQRDFLLKARLLHDFGCEKQQLTLLQGSIILSSFQFSFAPTKDFRFWFHNAIRIATQLGLHKQDLGQDLHPSTHKLCRRTWWMLYTRDVLFSLSGFANARCIYDEEADITAPDTNDWDEEDLSDQLKTILPPITELHKHFFIQNCQIARLGAKFLRLSRTHTSRITVSSADEFAEDLSAWRRQLPECLLLNHVREWSSSNGWIIILLAFSYRLECVFYRTAREHFRQNGDQQSVLRCKQNLTGAIFELDMLMTRAIIHGLVQHAPSSMIVCASNLLAFHIEIALDQTSSPSSKIMAKARIHALLAYLSDVGESWRIAKWTSKVSHWVVKRAGLMLTDDTDSEHRPQMPARSSNNVDSAINHQPDDGSFGQLDAFSNDPLAFNLDEALPEAWIQDFLGESFFGQLDDHLFNFIPS